MSKPSALECMDALRNKKFIDRTETEKLIVLMWEEYNGYESMAIKAAAELAVKDAELIMYQEFINDLKESLDMHPSWLIEQDLQELETRLQQEPQS